MPFSKAHSGSSKGKRRSTNYRHRGHLLAELDLISPGVWALIPDSLSQTTCSFSMKGSALKAIALSLFQICAAWKVFRILFWQDTREVHFLCEKPVAWLATQGHFPLACTSFSYWPQISVFGKDGWMASGWWVIRRLLPRSHEPQSLRSFHLHSNFIHRVPCCSFSRH